MAGGSCPEAWPPGRSTGCAYPKSGEARRWNDERIGIRTLGHAPAQATFGPNRLYRNGAY